MARITAAERKRQEAEAHDRAVYEALAWPKEPCPQPYSKERMADLAGDKHTGPARAWTYNAYSKRVTHGCFSRNSHAWEGSKVTSQTQGGPWFATEVEARLALRWAVCKEMAETLHRLVEAEAKAIAAAG